MAPLADVERRDFLEICEDRYQARSTVLTSQLPVARWPTAFSIGWCITPTASKCEANRCVKSAPARSSNFRRRAPSAAAGSRGVSPQPGAVTGLASLRSEKDERKSAVEMTPRAGGETHIQKKGKKDEDKTKLQLTHPGHFMHHNCASVASLRP